MKWNKSLDAVKEVFYDDSMDAFKENSLFLYSEPIEK